MQRTQHKPHGDCFLRPTRTQQFWPSSGPPQPYGSSVVLTREDEIHYLERQKQLVADVNKSDHHSVTCGSSFGRVTGFLLDKKAERGSLQHRPLFWRFFALSFSGNHVEAPQVLRCSRLKKRTQIFQRTGFLTGICSKFRAQLGPPGGCPCRGFASKRSQRRGHFAPIHIRRAKLTAEFLSSSSQVLSSSSQVLVKFYQIAFKPPSFRGRAAVTRRQASSIESGHPTGAVLRRLSKGGLTP